MAGVKQEVVNTFEKGMIMDLNPINTPNNVLTDCLNGTYITYDGNEFQLQNDRGNIPLKYSKLPKGYLPVGTTSYGDILYVVSYNPITNKTQIGTFPSPKLRSAYDNDCELSNVSILTKAVSEMNDPIKYTEAVEQYQKIVVYVDGDGNKELIINPGDQYCITDPDVSDYETYEKLQYFILTDKKELIEITDQVVADGEMHYVKWKIPGYLSTRWRLPQINENGFTVRTKGIHLDKGNDTTELTATINCQIGSDDTLLDGIYEHESLCIAELNEDDSIKTFDENKNITKIEERIKYDPVNYYITDVKCKDVIPNKQETYQTLLAPYADIKEAKRGLLFDQFKQASELIDLTNLFNVNNTHIAENYYYYTISENAYDKYKKATITFDIECSVVSEGEVELNIFATPLSTYINNNYQIPGTNKWKDISHGNVFDGIGQNIIEVEFDEEEQIYLINLQMSDGVTDPVNCYKMLICSKFMNNFDKDIYPNFEKITMNEWLHYLNELEIKLIGSPTYDTPQLVEKYAPDLENEDCFWTATEGTIDCFVLPDSKEKNRIDAWKRGYTYTIPNVYIKFKYGQKYLYNFCTTFYARGSKLSIPQLGRSIDVFRGADITDDVRGDITDNFYVERQYQDQNTEPTEGAVFDFKPACPEDKKDLLVIELASLGNKGEQILYENTSEHKLRTMIWGLKLEDVNLLNIKTYMSSTQDSEELASVLSKMYLSKSENATKLMNGPKVFTNVKDQASVFNMQTTITSVVNNFLESENIACVPGVIKIYHAADNYMTGVSTDNFASCAVVPGKSTSNSDNNSDEDSRDDRCCYVFGVFFRTKKLGPFFVPITQFSNYIKFATARTVDNKEERDKVGWDFALITPITKTKSEEASRWYIKAFSWLAGIISPTIESFTFANFPLTSTALGVYTLLKAKEMDSGAYAYDETGCWGIEKTIYDNLWKFVSKLQVNTNYAQFTDGYFLNRTFLEDKILDSLSVKYDYYTILSSIRINNTDVTLSKNWSFTQNSPIKLADMFYADWKNNEGSGSDIVISGEKICDFSNESEWPYVGENSLKAIDNLYDEQNSLISSQQEAWPNSIEFQNVAMGSSLGFYRKGKENYNLDQFVSLLHMTYNSDNILYQNKSIGKLSNVYADIADDSIETYWAFNVNNNNQYDRTYMFSDLTSDGDKTKGNNVNDPRYPLFVSKDMPYMDILNILNEEEDEIES